MVSSTLEEKLEQPHLRDLARNPMQLAILLHLIHVQGPALPEKRTTLYEEYMKLFFNREAEKSAIVRDRRELLLQIHGVLAWLLQTQAEMGAGSGSITRSALRAQVREYLETEEYDPTLADALLAGTVERVGALVSRVEGMFEFEVQPLREYFAARHLYKTAPYSPPGRRRSGTRPARFDALARSLYWTNVTRFFCGFYDEGELGTLVDGVLHLGEQEGYALINQPRQLGMMLLCDHVFSESPRAMKRLIAYVTEEPGFGRLAARDLPRRGRNMELPGTAGRDLLFEACLGKLEKEEDPGRRSALRQIMGGNAEWSKLKGLWIERFRKRVMKCDPLREALDYGIVNRFRVDEIEQHARANIDLRLRWLMWTENFGAIRQDAVLWATAGRSFFEDAMVFPRRVPLHGGAVVALEVLTQFLNVHMLAAVFSAEAESLPMYAFLDRMYGLGYTNLSEEANGLAEVEDELGEFAKFLTEHLGTDVGAWRTSLAPWVGLVNRAFEVAPRSNVVSQIAVLATAAHVEQDEGRWDEDRFGGTRGMVERLYFARCRYRDGKWWSRELERVRREESWVCLAVLLAWGEPQTLREVEELVGGRIEELGTKEWESVWTSCNCLVRAAKGRSSKVTAAWFEGGGTASARLALVVVGRVEDDAERRKCARTVFARYEGGDTLVLRGVAGWEFVLGRTDDVDWEFVCRLSRLGKKAGIEILWAMHASEIGEVPSRIAERVLQEGEEHCEQLVAVCERSRAMEVAGEAEKVATVAERDEWFAPHPG